MIQCDGKRETFDAVVVGIGVDLNLELARNAGLDIAQGIVVDAQGRTSDPAIFAAGDVAQHHHYGLCIQSWAFAQNQAVATAKAMLDPQAAGYDEAPWLWSDQYQYNIQILGIHLRGVKQSFAIMPFISRWMITDGSRSWWRLTMHAPSSWQNAGWRRDEICRTYRSLTRPFH
ncbi:Anthranilate 1,2-dioxygenase system ferredoxin--NAD(+) reductase component [Kluyvera cryocrescens]|uniref:Anthranilate 1,2-dioxygenase system ferredoxin--NAD(+) reductase component n=1 Tax=Kluyvera cryocrescens TaxID=580 RepID=A0A485B2E5_KLUCR|nr:Anthranilate 1,2-dioxygenase system ferredoxin--NAD(+) reductase component [Kluyvera cryocrescens]